MTEKIRLKKYGFNYQAIMQVLFFLTIAISVWAVRTHNSTLGSSFLKNSLKLIMYLLVIFEFIVTSILFFKKGKKTSLLLLMIAFWPVLYWLYIHIWVYDMESWGITSPIICFLFALQSVEVKSRVFFCFKKFVIITSAIGILFYIAYILKLSFPYEICPYYDEIPSRFYINFSNISFLYKDNVTLRLCGIFNEPGWLGTTLGLMLCYERINLKKIENIIMLIAGVLSFSVAFFLIVFIGFLLRHRNFKVWAVVFISIILLTFILPNIETNNSQINFILKRLTITSGGLAGNNRSSNTLDKELRDMLSSEKIFFGYGDGYAEDINKKHESKFVLSIKTEIVNFGLIGFSLLYIVPIYLFFKLSNKNEKALIFIACFWISLYQRPWLYLISNYMMLISVVSMLSYLNKKELCSMDEKIIKIKKS